MSPQETVGFGVAENLPIFFEIRRLRRANEKAAFRVPQARLPVIVAATGMMARN
jgi:hypothetical protein